LLQAKLNTHGIEAQGDNPVRLVAACERGHTTVTRILRKLEASGPRLDLDRALQEAGRVGKTIYLLNYQTAPELRRQVSCQLNKNESYHSLANALFWATAGS
jgi:TnpA family transposase